MCSSSEGVGRRRTGVLQFDYAQFVSLYALSLTRMRIEDRVMRMNHNVYLPDEVSEQAKAAELNLSRLLRDAVTNELERRKAVAATLNDVQVHEVEIEDSDGQFWTGRITGTCIAQDNDKGEVEVYLTDDERVIVYDGRRRQYHEINDPENELRDWLWPAGYTDALLALGMTPVIDI